MDFYFNNLATRGNPTQISSTHVELELTSNILKSGQTYTLDKPQMFFQLIANISFWQ